MVTKTYLPYYLCESGDGSDRSDVSESSDQKSCFSSLRNFLSPKFILQKKLFTTRKNIFHKNIFLQKKLFPQFCSLTKSFNQKSLFTKKKLFSHKDLFHQKTVVHQKIYFYE